MSTQLDKKNVRQFKDLDVPADLSSGAGETAWIEVIQKMDDVYSELVQSQTQVETQNARLEETQAFISSVLSAMTDVLIVCDTDCRIQRVNQALEELTGRTETELVGLPLADIFDPINGTTIDDLKYRVQQSGQLHDCELALAGIDGQPAPLSMNCTIRRDHRERLVGMVMVGRPIGELRKAYQELDTAHHRLTQTQQQLVVSEKMAALGRLVAGVAHELNNPISFILGNMHALKRYAVSIGKYLEACRPGRPHGELELLRKELKIDRILRDIGPLLEGTTEGADRVSDIVQDLRRFSSNQEEPVEQFNVSRVVRTSADWVVKTERTKPQVIFEMPDRLDVFGRKGQLHQVLVNLVQNAVDALAETPRPAIEIHCRNDRDDVVIEVADNGPGIARENLDKIFEPFFTTKPIGQGTGLGLYVSYGIAQKLGGDLTARPAPNGGAVFTLRIPADAR
ncbi:MAG: ATP-binding protein [Filomicrobium sp.]